MDQTSLANRQFIIFLSYSTDHKRSRSKEVLSHSTDNLTLEIKSSEQTNDRDLIQIIRFTVAVLFQSLIQQTSKFRSHSTDHSKSGHFFYMPFRSFLIQISVSFDHSKSEHYFTCSVFGSFFSNSKQSIQNTVSFHRPFKVHYSSTKSVFK